MKDVSQRGRYLGQHLKIANCPFVGEAEEELFTQRAIKLPSRESEEWSHSIYKIDTFELQWNQFACRNMALRLKLDQP